MTANILTTLLQATDTNPERQAGLYRPPPGESNAIQAAANALGLSFARVDLAGCTDKRQLLERIAAALAFPDWFGYNWDALADCLADLSWLKENGHVVVIENSNDLYAHAPEPLDTALQIFAEAAQRQRDQHTPLWVFTDLSLPALPWLPRP